MVKELAIHESAHAVVALYLDISIKEVTIRKDADSAGHTLFHNVESIAEPIERMNFATALLAARASVELLCPEFTDERAYESDERGVLTVSGFLCSTEEECRAFEKWRAECFDRAQEIVRRPHISSAIQLLANDLMKSKVALADHVRRLLGACEAKLRPTARQRFEKSDQRFRQRVESRHTRYIRKRIREAQRAGLLPHDLFGK
jgi:hypothetical protein